MQSIFTSAMQLPIIPDVPSESPNTTQTGKFHEQSMLSIWAWGIFTQQGVWICIASGIPSRVGTKKKPSPIICTTRVSGTCPSFVRPIRTLWPRTCIRQLDARNYSRDNRWVVVNITIQVIVVLLRGVSSTYSRNVATCARRVIPFLRMWGSVRRWTIIRLGF